MLKTDDPNVQKIIKQFKKGQPNSGKDRSAYYRKPLKEKESLNSQLVQWAVPVSVFLGITFLFFFIHAAFDFNWERS